MRGLNKHEGFAGMLSCGNKTISRTNDKWDKGTGDTNVRKHFTGKQENKTGSDEELTNWPDITKPNRPWHTVKQLSICGKQEKLRTLMEKKTSGRTKPNRYPLISGWSPFHTVHSSAARLFSQHRTAAVSPRLKQRYKSISDIYLNREAQNFGVFLFLFFVKLNDKFQFHLYFSQMDQMKQTVQYFHFRDVQGAHYFHVLDCLF